MTVEDLVELDRPALAGYVRRRLRREPPLDPPLDDRHGAEPPEQFLIHAAREVPGLHQALVQAVRDNLGELARQQAADPACSSHPRTNQHIASLAYLATRLPATELAQPFYTLACSWFLDAGELPEDLDDGRFHVLRALAMLQRDATLAPFWENLWRMGPRSVRGLTMFGWARADDGRALQHLDELIQTEGIDLPATLWALAGPDGPGVPAMAEAAAVLPDALRRKITRALRSAGADAETLRRLRAASSGFEWVVIDINLEAAQQPSWSEKIAA